MLLSTPNSSVFLDRVARQRKLTPTVGDSVVVWRGRYSVLIDVLRMASDQDANAWLCEVESAASKPSTRRIVIKAPREGLGSLPCLERLRAGLRLRTAFQRCEEVLFVTDSERSNLQAKLLVSFCRLPHAEVCPFLEFCEVAGVLLGDLDLDVVQPRFQNIQGESS